MVMSSGGLGSAPPPSSDPSSDKSVNAKAPVGQGLDPTDGPHSDPNKNNNGKAATDQMAAKDKGTDQKNSMSQPKAFSATCIPKSTERIKIDLPSD